jgi:hypothetical protein
MQVCKTKEAGSLRALNNMLHAAPHPFLVRMFAARGMLTCLI